MMEDLKLSTYVMAAGLAVHFFGYELARAASISMISAADSSALSYTVALGIPASAFTLYLYTKSIKTNGTQHTFRMSNLGCIFIFAVVTLLGFLKLKGYYYRILIVSFYAFREIYCTLISTQLWAFIVSVLDKKSSSLIVTYSAIVSLTSTIGGFLVEQIVNIFGVQGLLVASTLAMLGTSACVEVAYFLHPTSVRVSFNGIEGRCQTDVAKKSTEPNKSSDIQSHLALPDQGVDSHPKSTTNDIVTEKSNSSSVWRGSWNLMTTNRTLQLLFVEALIHQFTSNMLNLMFHDGLRKDIAENGFRAVIVGRFFACVNFSSCVLQCFVIPKILSHSTLPLVILAVPLLIFLMSSLVAMAPSLLAVMFTFGSLKVLEYAVLSGASEMVYMPMGAEIRYVGKEFVRFFGHKLGKSASSLILSCASSQFAASLGTQTVWSAILALCWVASTSVLSRHLVNVCDSAVPDSCAAGGGGGGGESVCSDDDAAMMVSSSSQSGAKQKSGQSVAVEPPGAVPTLRLQQSQNLMARMVAVLKTPSTGIASSRDINERGLLEFLLRPSVQVDAASGRLRGLFEYVMKTTCSVPTASVSGNRQGCGAGRDETSPMLPHLSYWNKFRRNIAPPPSLQSPVVLSTGPAVPLSASSSSSSASLSASLTSSPPSVLPRHVTQLLRSTSGDGNITERGFSLPQNDFSLPLTGGLRRRSSAAITSSLSNPPSSSLPRLQRDVNREGRWTQNEIGSGNGTSSSSSSSSSRDFPVVVAPGMDDEDHYNTPGDDHSVCRNRWGEGVAVKCSGDSGRGYTVGGGSGGEKRGGGGGGSDYDDRTWDYSLCTSSDTEGDQASSSSALATTHNISTTAANDIHEPKKTLELIVDVATGPHSHTANNTTSLEILAGGQHPQPEALSPDSPACATLLRVGSTHVNLNNWRDEYEVCSHL